MPHCYFVNDYRQSERGVIDSPAPERADHGLPPPPPPGAAPAAGGEKDGSDGVRRGTTPVGRSGGGIGRGGEDTSGRGTSGRGGRRRPGGGASTAAGGGLAEDRGLGDGEEGCGPIVLCNFNRLHKIDPHTFGAWTEVQSTCAPRPVFVAGSLVVLVAAAVW